MKNEHHKAIEKLNESKRQERIALETNQQLIDKVNQLQSELESQKLLNKNLKGEKKEFEEQSLKQAAKIESLQEFLKMFQPGNNNNMQMAQDQQLMGGTFTGRSQPLMNQMMMGDEMDFIRDNQMSVEPQVLQFIETYREAGSDDQFQSQPNEVLEQEIAEFHDDIRSDSGVIDEEQLMTSDHQSTEQVILELDERQPMKVDSHEQVKISIVDANVAEMPVQVKKEEEQLSMDDGPSFVSPNGSFERVKDAQELKMVTHSSLNDVMVAEPGA